MSDRICIRSGSRYVVRLSAGNLLSCCKLCGKGCKGGFPGGAWMHWSVDFIKFVSWICTQFFFFNFAYRKKHGIVTGGSYSSDYVNTKYYYFFKFNILVLIKFPYSIKGCQNYPFFPCYQPKTKGSVKSKCPKSENTLLECRHTCRTAYNKSYKHDLFYGTLTRNTSHSIEV